MKFAVITTALALAIGASASAFIEYGADGSVMRISNVESPAPARARLARAAAGACSPCRNRCLKGVKSALTADADFCTSFLAATYTVATDFAPVQTQCASNADSVSSACSCLVQPATSTADATTTSTSSTEPSSTESSTTTEESSTTESSTTESSTTESSTTESSTTESSSTPSATPTTPPCVVTNQLCTINTYLDCCSQCCYFPNGDLNNGLCC